MSTAAAQAKDTLEVRATGPRTAEGKAVSSRNAITHGLTAKSPILPSEDPAEFEAYREAMIARFKPDSDEFKAAVFEYTDINWRLNRIASQETKLIALEVQRILIESRKCEDLRELLLAIDGANDRAMMEALAIDRLSRSKTLTNLHRHEDRLMRRMKQIEARLQHYLNIASALRATEIRRQRQEASRASDAAFEKEMQNKLPWLRKPVDTEPVEIPSEKPPR